MSFALLPRLMTTEQAAALPIAPPGHIAWGALWLADDEIAEFAHDGALWRLRKSPDGQWFRARVA